MKFVFAAFAGLCMAASPTVLHAQEAEEEVTRPTNLQLAQEIVDQGFPEEGRMAMFSGVASQMIAQIRNSMPMIGEVPKLDAAMDRHVVRTTELMESVLADHMDDLMDGIVIAYAESFERDELEGLHAFITSPAGQGFLAKSTMVMSHPEFAAANQRYIDEYMPRAMNLNQEFQADVMRIISEMQAQ